MSLLKYLACIDQSEKDKWLSKLDNSNWLLQVKEALTTACIVAQTIDREGKFRYEGKEMTDYFFFCFLRNISSYSWQ